MRPSLRKISFASFLALLLPLLAGAQTSVRTSDFRTPADSLIARLERHMGMHSNKPRIQKILRSGDILDFYFTQELGDYPWRAEDIEWFRTTLKNVFNTSYRNCSVGTIYVKNNNLESYAMPSAGNNGRPADNPFRVSAPAASRPLVSFGETWQQGLSGRHIALWQSHGRYWENRTGRWEWQRAATHRTVEDLFTQSFVLQFLIPMLENAGAVVLTPRERDTQINEAVCDNDASFHRAANDTVRRSGTYRESGNWTDAGTGFADVKRVYNGSEDIFSMGSARKASTAPPSTTDPHRKATARWTPDIPEKGEYAVYVAYKSLHNSTNDARYTVHHRGGETLVQVNQRMGGGMWVYIGTYSFDKGNDGYVELSNLSNSTGVVTADAVRFGGGMGKIERESGTGTSGLPCYTEGALYSMLYGGFPMSLFSDWDDDYTRDFAGRGRWVQELTGGSRVNPDKRGRKIPIDLSFAFHSDAGVTPNDSIVGTLAIYTLLADGSDQYPDGESRLNGRMLCDFVQTQLVDDIRRGFEPQWTRRQLWDRSYSESRTTGVPGMLLELLSHQNFADMRYGLDPAFRFTASRAVYKGILKYLSARYGVRYSVQPLPPKDFRVRLGERSARLSWHPTDDPAEPTARAETYIVYTRIDDGEFDTGVSVSDTCCTIQMNPGHLYSFKVVAANKGGKSFPSEVLCAGIAGRKKAIVVNNFTRVSAPCWFDTPTYAGFTDNVDSGVPWGEDILFAGEVNQFNRLCEWTDDDNPGFGGSYVDHAGSRIAGNSFDFVSLHARAFLNAGYSVESSSASAFDGSADASVMDLVCGKQLGTRMGSGRVPDRYRVFPDGMKAAIRRFTDNGGDIIVSGAYIATDIWDGVYPSVVRPSSEDRDFIQQVLGYKWVTNFGDRSGSVTPFPQSPLQLPPVHYNNTYSDLIYRVENPDGIAPASDQAQALMRYRSNHITAAVLYDQGSYHAASFGFPLETCDKLNEIIAKLTDYFEHN